MGNRKGSVAGLGQGMKSRPNSPSRRWVKHLIGFLITAICLIVFFKQVNFREILDAFMNFQWGYLVVGLISLSFGYAMRIFRWSVLLQSAGAKAGFAVCSAPFLGSIALNNVLPLRLGDVVRALVFPNSMGVSRVAATSSLIMERLIDLISLLSCFAIGLFAIHTVAVPSELKSLAVTLSVFCGICLFLGFMFSEKLSRMLGDLVKKNDSFTKLEIVYKTAAGLLDGFNSMSRPAILIRVMIMSVFVWLGEAGLFYFVLMGAGVESSLVISMLVMSMATLSTLVPSSPGYVGPFHLAAFTAISLVGGPAAQAGSYAVIVHLSLWLPTTIAGLVAIWMRPELFRIAKSQAVKR